MTLDELRAAAEAAHLAQRLFWAASDGATGKRQLKLRGYSMLMEDAKKYASRQADEIERHELP